MVGDKPFNVLESSACDERALEFEGCRDDESIVRPTSSHGAAVSDGRDPIIRRARSAAALSTWRILRRLYRAPVAAFAGTPLFDAEGWDGLCGAR